MISAASRPNPKQSLGVTVRAWLLFLCSGALLGQSSPESFASIKAAGAQKSSYRDQRTPRAATSTPTADLANFRDRIAPVLRSACTKCHGPDKQKGDFRIDTLNPDLFTGDDVDWWLDVLSVLTNGEMPPEDADPLADDDRRQVVEWLSSEMHVASSTRRATTEHTSFRRMSRYEYNYALQDLLGLPFAFADDLPPDPTSEDGFQNSSEVLHLSVTQLQTYLASGRKALLAATVANKQPAPLYWNIDLRERAQATWTRQDDQVKKFDAKHPEQTEDLQTKRKKMLASHRRRHGGPHFANVETGRRAGYPWNYNGAKHAWHPSATAPVDPPGGDDLVVLPPRQAMIVELGNKIPDRGTMRVRVRATRSEGPAPVLRLMFGWQASNDSRAVMKLKDSDRVVSAAPGERRFYEWRVPTSQIYPRNLVRKTAKMGTTPSPSEYIKIVHASKAGGDVHVDFVEVTAPFYQTWPPASHTKIFIAKEPRSSESAYARRVIEAFMERAWRRAPTQRELGRKVELFQKLRPTCDDLREAMVETLASVLASPNFLYLITTAPAKPGAGVPPKLRDPELATRLSMFLWCSIPDQELRGLAARGRLADPETLQAQVQRMLADPKGARFAHQFVDQWLGLQLLDFLHVDRKRYPAFDESLKEAMKGEPAAFFREVLAQDLSVLEFLQSDFTMVNERLADHYGLKGVTGSRFQRADLRDKPHRGGLLTQAGLLAMNSDGIDSHPLKRGIWLLERLLNDPPPPPPAAVPEIDLTDPEVAKMTLKQRIEDHRNAPACMSCHAKIDPWGIAFENYDAVGSYRNKVQGQPVDSVSLLFNRQKLDGADGLKRFLLRNRQDQFVRAMVHHLTTFALGRPLGFGDRAAIEEITAGVRQRGDGLATMVTTIATSSLFQTK
jgi:mono/diheme cytochrome c family protein